MKMEGEGWCGRNSETLVDLCQLPTWLIETCIKIERFVGCLNLFYATLEVAYASLKWRMPPLGVQA